MTIAAVQSFMSASNRPETVVVKGRALPTQGVIAVAFFTICRVTGLLVVRVCGPVIIV